MGIKDARKFENVYAEITDMKVRQLGNNYPWLRAQKCNANL